MDGEIAYNYETLGDYNHLNPCRAGLLDVTQEQSVLDCPWSSLAGGHALLPHQRAQWLVAEQGLAAMGVEDTVEGRKIGRALGQTSGEGAVRWQWMRMPTRGGVTCEGDDIGKNRRSPSS